MRTKVLVIFLIYLGFSMNMNAQEIKLPAPDKKGGKTLMETLNE